MDLVDMDAPFKKCTQPGRLRAESGTADVLGMRHAPKWRGGGGMKLPFDSQIAEGSLLHIPQGEGGHAMGVRLGGFVATACHCLPRADGRVVLPNPDLPGEDVVLVEVALPSGSKSARGAIVSADPCSDLALVGDSTHYGTDLAPEDGERFHALLDGLLPARPNLEPSMVDERPVFILTHERRWISGRASFGAITLERPGDRVLPGTSGAPVFDENGLVLGVVSQGYVDRPEGRMATLVDSLPGWARDLLSAAEE